MRGNHEISTEIIFARVTKKEKKRIKSVLSISKKKRETMSDIVRLGVMNEVIRRAA